MRGASGSRAHSRPRSRRPEGRGRRDLLHLQRAVDMVRIRRRLRAGIPEGRDGQRSRHQRFRLPGATRRASPPGGRDEHRPEVDGPGVLPEDLRGISCSGARHDREERERNACGDHQSPRHRGERFRGVDPLRRGLRRRGRPGNSPPPLYVGNYPLEGAEDTACPECGAIVVRRNRYRTNPSGLTGNRCASCSASLRFVV
jgi:hypothetical protein